MTDDARDAAIGRTVTEYRDAKTRLTALRGELARTAEALHAIARGLRDTPELLDFGGDSFTLSDMAKRKPINPKALDREHLYAQVQDYRALRQRVDELAGQIKEFGLTP